MKNIILIFWGLLTILFLSSWGFFAHYKINRLSVFILPKAMQSFYLNNIEFITQHAVSADKRRYVDSSEAPKHFLNADHYGKHPFKVIPLNWYDAALKYSADTLNKYGTLPWTIEFNYFELVRAFKARDTIRILTISANLGHYIADAYVPLHLTLNYNGQLSNQTGIHALWESRLPELFSTSYKLYLGKARYIESPIKEAFIICRSSYTSVDSVLRFEQELNSHYPANKKYISTLRGNRHIQEYSTEYANAYNKKLKGMVERKMRSAILTIGSFWFSAWVDAGQPDLYKLVKHPLNQETRKQINNEEHKFKGK